MIMILAVGVLRFYLKQTNTVMPDEIRVVV